MLAKRDRRTAEKVSKCNAGKKAEKKRLYAFQDASICAEPQMKTTPSKTKPGPKPSGRQTHAVNLRMEESLRGRLIRVSTKHNPRISQVALVEEGLGAILPKYEQNIR